MKNLLFGILLMLTSSVATFAQFTYDIVQDQPNNGQLKRMVFIKWDDWKPDPGTILGIPKNAQGYLFWRVLNRSYYKGEDRRPYRLPDGPFIKNYADLNLQETTDSKITDTTEKIRNTHSATYLNMSGGTADLPYTLFYKRKFEDIYGSVDEWLRGMQSESPKAYDAAMKSAYFQKFMEYLDVTKDRVKGVHESFVDKGVRLEAYTKIYKELQEKYNVISHYLAGQVMLSKFPTPTDLKKNTTIPVFNKDKEIVRHILTNFKF
ncbi:MAG: hypothetical protein J7497_09260 [Chitinophagaceae bacterium]|nr:hypothetical protein [Chitinophagaceae bacterium]